MRLDRLAVGSLCIALGLGVGACGDDDDIDQGVSTGGIGGIGTGGVGGTYGTGGTSATGGTGGAGGAGGMGGATGGTGGAGGMGGTGGGAGTVAYAQVKPIFMAKCTPCHSAGGIGAFAHTLADSDADAKVTSPEAACMGMTKGACTLARVKAGAMPLGAGCTGDPAQDAGKAACLTQQEQDLLAAWIAGGLM